MDYPVLFAQGIAGMPAHCWRSPKLPGPGLVFHGGLAPASPPVCLGLVEQSASRSFSQAVGWLHTRWLRAKAVGDIFSYLLCG